MLRITCGLFGVLALLTAGSANAELENTLRDHASPYLRMHGDDPVKWQTWDAATVARAKQENKLLFVSIGYFSCHWCHVMQRESYRNAQIAALLNRHFIPVKVDRELNPALDARLIEFVQATRGYSGWPLNVFVTPAGHPLIGVVYLPPDNFRKLVSELGQLWQTGHESLKQDAASGAAELAAATAGGQPVLLDSEHAQRYLDSFRRNIWGNTDEFGGGFGDQSKFPSVPQLDALLNLYRADPSDRLGRFLRLTLDRMSQAGLYDLLGGGFFRYVVDPEWRVPHFEKMLYDNALLADLYLRAAETLDEPRYRQVARATLDFMLAELRTPQGAFAASLSALDAAGVEGGYYLWTHEQLQARLDAEELRVAEVAWGMQGSPTTEDGYLPVVAMDVTETAAELSLPEGQVDKLLVSAREKLLAARRDRRAPLDDKRLAAWNGLALIALGRAARLPDGTVYRQAARGVRDYLATQLWDGETLSRARDETGRPIGESALEDYAYAAAGMLAWAQLSGDAADYKIARAMVDQAWRRFHSEAGWRLTEQPLLAYGGAEALIADGPMPSPSALLAQTALALARHGEDDALRKRALYALGAGQALVLADPYWFASHVRVAAAAMR